jgi:uncharacterized protein YcbK (DUF882 family)
MALQTKDGYYVWPKGEKHRLGKWFYTYECDCRCKHSTCKTQKVAVALIEKLDASRDELGLPIWLTSVFRCRRHQNKLASGGTVETVALGKPSTHEKGDAADLKSTDEGLKRLPAILANHFDAVGVGKSFHHADLRTGKKRRWTYSY